MSSYWPFPVSPGENILASQYNELLNGVQNWQGQVNGGGYALINAILPQGSTTVVGGVKQGTGVTIDGTGTLNLNIATAAGLGGVKAGTGVNIAADGTITLMPGSISVVGGVKQGSGINIAADGTITALAGGSQVNTDWSATSGITEILNKPAIAWDGTTSTATAPFAVEQGITVETASQSMVIGDRGDGDIGFNASNSTITFGNQNQASASSVYIASSLGGYLTINDYGTTGAQFQVHVAPSPAYAEITCSPGIQFQSQLQLAYRYTITYLCPTPTTIYQTLVDSGNNLNINVSTNSGSTWANAMSINPANQVIFGGLAVFDGTIICDTFQAPNSLSTYTFYNNTTNAGFVVNLSSGNAHIGESGGDGYLYLDPSVRASSVLINGGQTLSWFSGAAWSGSFGQLGVGQKINSADPGIYSSTGWLEINAGVHLSSDAGMECYASDNSKYVQLYAAAGTANPQLVSSTGRLETTSTFAAMSGAVLVWNRSDNAIAAQLDFGGPNNCARVNAGTNDLDLISNIVTARCPLSCVGQFVAYSPDTTNSLAINVANGSGASTTLATAGGPLIVTAGNATTFNLPAIGNAWIVISAGSHSGNIGIASGQGGYELYLYSPTGWVDVESNLYISGQCQATAFNTHATSLGAARTMMLNEDHKYAVSVGAWSLVSAEDGVRILVKHADGVKEVFLPWSI